MRISIAQLNPTVGDVEGNVSLLASALQQTTGDKPDLIVFPELFLVGYPPRDLLEHSWLHSRIQTALREIYSLSRTYMDTGIILGLPLPTNKEYGHSLYNAACLFYQGKMIFCQPKTLLPSYDVFDEVRYFDPADSIGTVEFKDERIGISICEDAWNVPESLFTSKRYREDPVALQALKGASLFINIAASPFHAGKDGVRYAILRHHAHKHGIPLLYVNQVGGNDELIFDGRSMYIDSNGNPAVVLPAFREAVVTVDTQASGDSSGFQPLDPVEAIYKALVLGTRDYFRKCGFSKAVIGLSGGIDSALTACIAADALGEENVLGISMPSRYSSEGSVEDSRLLAAHLGIAFEIKPITPVYDSYLSSLRADFEGLPMNEAEENIQARIRGNILMAYSNKFGYIVLSTGNKSEMAVGYCTLYGDMSGGLSILSDVPKTTVYALAGYVNRSAEVIPQEIIEKAPSAELRPDQKDQDTLPPYDLLDKVLKLYIEDNLSAEEIINLGFDRDTVYWIVKAVYRNEYKRRQAPPGLKISPKAFGSGRRIPIAARGEI